MKYKHKNLPFEVEIWVYALLYMLEQQDYMWNKQNA